MRLQTDFTINDEDPNTVIDKGEIASVYFCLERYWGGIFGNKSGTANDYQPYDCCKATYTLEDYATGNYVITAQCWLSAGWNEFLPED